MLILSTTKPSLSSSEPRSGTRKSSLLNQAPKRTPICLTPALALELLTTATHSPSTFRADPIQNVGDKLRIRLEGTQSDEGHTHLAPQWFELRYCVCMFHSKAGVTVRNCVATPFGRCVEAVRFRQYAWDHHLLATVPDSPLLFKSSSFVCCSGVRSL
jgi:hypothetical protein